MKMSSSVQTNKKKIPKMIIHNLNHKNSNSLSNYYFNVLKNKQLIADYNNNLKKKNIIKSNSTIMNISNVKINLSHKLSEKNNKEILPKISAYTFIYFCN